MNLTNCLYNGCGGWSEALACLLQARHGRRDANILFRWDSENGYNHHTSMSKMPTLGTLGEIYAILKKKTRNNAPPSGL